MRPEDGAFDPTNPNVFYFLTTASFTGQSRLYKLTFDDITNPTSGGTIEAVLSSSDLPVNGSTGPRMMDNMTVSAEGLVYIQEDPGNQAHTAKTWEYNPFTDTLTEVAANDVARFGAPGIAATAPYNQDEENSGIIEVTSILGDADTSAFLVDTQAHYNIPGELVQGGQLAVMYIDEVKDGGAGNDRVAGDAGNNKLNGFAGDDNVLGGSGNDVLIGGRGNDIIDGGRGNDVLQGGLDNDSFVITVNNGDVDVITDFKAGQDTLALDTGVTVLSASIQRVVATEANGFDLDNSDRAFDLTLVLQNGSATQTLHILDAYAFATNAYWEQTLGLDLTYPQPLPAANDVQLISNLAIA
jgi:Ca2+-binding RTX toxin-like protein